jgi:hypothetical protein
LGVTSNSHSDARESRRELHAPVRIWGMNASGAPFIQQAHTVDVGLLSARIAGLGHQVSAGEILGVEYCGRKGRFQVVWAGQSGTPEAGKIELRSLDEVQDFWGFRLGMLAEQREPVERRAAKRYACKGSASIRQQETKFPLGATVSDISLSGCYAELLTTLPVGTKVELLLQVVETTVHCAAEVRTSHPGVGMGIKFEQMSETDSAALKKVIARLSSSAL